MKNMKYQTIIIIFTIATISILSSPSQCTNLIETTCKKTPKYDLCVQTLKSDPSSSNTDVTGLAIIMVKIMATKAGATSGKINQLLNNGHLEPKQEKALRSCAESYKMAIETFVPEAKEALESGNPKFAEEGVTGIGESGEDCERDFSGGTSPLTKENYALRDLAVVALAIVRLCY